LMSATINPPNQAAYAGMANNGQKSHQSLQYGSNLNTHSMQPNTQLYVQFDPSQMLGQGQGQTVNVGSQQVIGSHLVQQRPVQNSPSSYLSQQPYQQTSYYQQSGLQGLQQVTSPTQFSVQGFNQPNLGIQLQPSGQPQGLSLAAQTVNKQPMQFREPPPQTTMQKPPSQLRTPPESMTNIYQAIGTPAQNPSSKQHKEAANLTAKAGINVKPQQRYQQQPYGQKIGTQYVGQPIQPTDFSGTVIGRPQLVMGNVMGAARAPHPSAAAANARYQQTYQQPTVPVMMSQRQQQPQQVQATPQGIQPNQRNSQQQQSLPGNMALIKAQQAKQRAELLQTASNFLNPEKIPKEIKSTGTAEEDPKINTKTTDDKTEDKPTSEES